jgi:hypothetical protein
MHNWHKTEHDGLFGRGAFPRPPRYVGPLSSENQKSANQLKRNLLVTSHHVHTRFGHLIVNDDRLSSSLVMVGLMTFSWKTKITLAKFK